MSAAAENGFAIIVIAVFCKQWQKIYSARSNSECCSLLSPQSSFLFQLLGEYGTTVYFYKCLYLRYYSLLYNHGGSESSFNFFCFSFSCFNAVGSDTKKCSSFKIFMGKTQTFRDRDGYENHYVKWSVSWSVHIILRKWWRSGIGNRLDGQIACYSNENGIKMGEFH